MSAPGNVSLSPLLPWLTVAGVVFGAGGGWAIVNSQVQSHEDRLDQVERLSSEAHMAIPVMQNDMQHIKEDLATLKGDVRLILQELRQSHIDPR